MKKYAKEFRLSTAPQRSPQWYAERAGIPSASGLGLLFDTLRDGITPSSKAKQYLKQLAYERKFKTNYELFDTKAMSDGRYYEDFAKRLYEQETGNKLAEAFSYISSWFIATPDARVQEAVKGKGMAEGYATQVYTWGGLECKVVGDKTFLEFSQESLPIAHELQTQGQMMASGWDWVDYIIVNLKTQAYYIRRVHRNNKLIKRIYERLHEDLNIPDLDFGDVKRFDANLLQEYIEGSGLQPPPEPIEKIIVPF